MSLVLQDIVKSLEAGMRTEFQKLYAGTPVQYEQITTVIDSNKRTEEYTWLGSTPEMREWIDERRKSSLNEKYFSATNLKYEVTLEVKRDDIEDDLTGQYILRAGQLGEEARRYVDKLTFTTLAAGNATTCYDGQNFFSASHSEGSSGTQSNLGTTALSATNLKTAITNFENLLDDQGKPFGVIADTLVIPPALKWTAMELLNSSFYPEEGTTTAKLATNVLQGALKLVVSPYITDTDSWFLMDTSRIVKPVIFQKRTEVELSSTTDPNSSDDVFNRDVFNYGVRQRGKIVLGDWHLAYASIPS